MEEFAKGVVEEYLAYQRRVLNTLLDRGVYTQEGIDDHIRCLREAIEEDLDSNKAYALLKMEMDVKKGIRDEEKEYVSLTHIARQKNFENPSYVIQSWLRDRNTLDILYLWERENNPDFQKDGYENIVNKLSNPSFTLTAKIWKEETGATGIISKQGNGGGTFAHEDIAIDFYAWTFPQKRYQLVKIISGKAAFLNLIHEDLQEQKERYHTNNIMVQNGEPLLIDMDTLCMGHPVFELGSMFNAFIGYSELDHQVTMNFFGYTHESAEKFWDMSLKMYLGTEDEEVCRNVAEKAMIIGYTRMLRRAIRRPEEADSPAKTARCKEMLATLLEKIDSLCFDC